MTCEINPIFVPVGQEQDIVVYTAKKIITMEHENPVATAVAVLGKRIIIAGALNEIKSFLGNAPYHLNDIFASKIIMPGLIDQHLHPALGALTLAVEVIAPEDWIVPGKTWKKASNQEEYVTRLSQANATLKDSTEWLFTWGYHQFFHGLIDKKSLDNISISRPIAVWHRSAHEFYVNTAALKALGITEESIQGKGLFSEQTDWAKGHFYEGGLNLILPAILPKLATPERITFGLKQLVKMLHQNGVTAYNEPGALMTPDIWKLYQQILGSNDTPLYSFFIADGRGIVDRYGLEGALTETEKTIALAPSGDGKMQFFNKQIKLFADGAIISQLMQMEGGYTDGHHGEWMMTPRNLEERAKLYWDAGYQLHIHVNGDLGLETVLDVLEHRMGENPRSNHRSVVVHFATSTEEQIARIARLGAIVSANPYYTVGFADKYGKVGLGPERADAMVCSASVLKHHIPLSFHSDLPMGPSDPLNFVWCAVNRVTPSGRIACPEERIGVEDALRAITIEAAYSWQKENELGSVAPGKIANFTVL